VLFDLARGRVKFGRRRADLSGREALLGVMRALAESPGALVPTGVLIERAWGVTYHPLRHHSRVTMAISRLRKLLGAKAIAGNRDGYEIRVTAPWAVIDRSE